MKQKLLQKISDYLITKNNDSGIGLLNGNMGICIFLYHSYKETGNNTYKKYADDLIDDIYKNLKPSDVTFETGLAGIGWGINYLVTQEFCKGNTNLILKEIDSCIYRFFQSKPKLTLNLLNGLTGYLLYTISRLKNIQNQSNNESKTINRLLLIDIINKFDEETSNAFKHLSKDIYTDLFNAFPWAIYSLKEALALNIFNEKINYILKEWLYNFEVNWPRLHIHRMALAISLKMIDQQLDKPLFSKLIKNLLYTVEKEIIFKELNPYLYNMSGGWHGYIFLLKMGSEIFEENKIPNYFLFEKVRNKILNKNKSIFATYIDDILTDSKEYSPPNLGIKDGLAGVGLSRILYANAFS